MCDFSIDYILNRAGEKYVGTNASMSVLQQRMQLQQNAYANCTAEALTMAAAAAAAERNMEQFPFFDWLQYTRYHPPKLPRSQRPGPAKRTPGRLPRIPFTSIQLEALESAYQRANYLSAEEANKLAETLELTNTRVKIWFQNRRARERREKRERDESYESTVSSNASSPEPEMVVIV